MSKKINQLEANENLVLRSLISNVNNGITNKGAPYLSITLQDSTGTIEAKYWDVKPEQVKLIEAGKVYDIELEILEYRKALQGKIQNVVLINDDSFEILDYIKSSLVPKDELKQGIKTYINQIKNPIIHQMLVEVMKEFHVDFFEYPAASKNHHNYGSGLATHVYGMLKLADSMCTLYPLLSRDLLYAGVILHDIGKVDELSGAFLTEYTLQGKLLGHISIMQAKLYEIAKRFNLENTEEVMLMRHMILSHHGQLEYGSPVLPLIPEAEILQYIDNIDARMDTLKTTFEQTNDNEFSSRIFPLENRMFYKHKL